MPRLNDFGEPFGREEFALTESVVNLKYAAFINNANQITRTMRKTILSLGSVVIMLAMIACGGDSTETVESGTYEGSIQEVNASESEIYVQTLDEGTLELYFTEETQLTQSGQEVPFDSLEQGQQVEVQVEQVGQRLDPINVEILE